MGEPPPRPAHHSPSPRATLGRSCPPSLRSRRTELLRRALFGLLLIAVLPCSASAQIFLASTPHPEFVVGPLFLIANVSPDLSVTVNLSFSLTLQPGASRSSLEQDLFLLWPT